MEKLNITKIIFERGIYLEDFKNTPIPVVVEQRKWQSFIKAPGMANITLVKEFFASMDPDVVKKHGPVLVRDREVKIDARIINDLLETPNYENLSNGYASVSLGKSEIARALRGIDDGRWDSKYELKQSQLPQLLAFWNLFHSYSLMPVLHRTTIAEHRADLLYSYISGTKIDVGQVILSAILDAGRINVHRGAKLKPIIFPSLITALLKKDGVIELDTNELLSNKMGDLNLRSWNDITSKTRGKKRHFQRTAGSTVGTSVSEEQAAQRAAEEAEKKRAEEEAACLSKGKEHG
ncbi:hypothetical protein Dsin_016493 [Dipteronia sinensis]|uniref:Putative plant transposon protein domain-containing protein n=1 Tax=Dipteronia sinensis TaxID=43782 RepID=A0AAE0AEH0_9ROSI|nr:hypothetical protein Dsin_016493 [Dipteronia sinensis]